jgi:hypothetical protein
VPHLFPGLFIKRAGAGEEKAVLRFGLALLVAASVGLAWNAPATSQENPRSVTCKGMLADVWLRPKDKWPLAVIFDRDHGYTCAFDRGNATHDPLKACIVGGTCRISGTFRRHEGYAGPNPTFSIQMLEAVERVDDDP